MFFECVPIFKHFLTIETLQTAGGEGGREGGREGVTVVVIKVSGVSHYVCSLSLVQLPLQEVQQLTHKHCRKNIMIPYTDSYISHSIDIVYSGHQTLF